jgi:[protein-PII] uridylyltransferase
MVDQLEARARSVDDQVRLAFERAQPRVTVIAVGGYGRRELFPYSDIDLLLLADEPVERDAIAEFLRLLWDGGLRVSQSVRTAAECAELHENNLELTISLLDRRYVCGADGRYQELNEGFGALLSKQRSAIVARLCRMTRERHAKYHDTIYHLEPNIKEHPGGLRDLHTIAWLSKLREVPAADFGEARAFLASVRSWLHCQSRRDNNLLGFETQERISSDAAAWMREYYRHARQVRRAVLDAMDASESASAGLLAQFRDWRARLSNSEFTVSRERVLLRNPGLLRNDSGAPMRLMQFIARHQLPLAPDTERRLAERAQASEFRVLWPELRDLLRMPHCARALRAMAELGLLERLLPEWRRIDCLVVRDFYHRYTVDEHTLVAIESLEDLARTPDPARRRFAELLEEVSDTAPLRLALLLHDLGKGDGGEHVARSSAIAAEALERLAVPQADRDVVLFLIGHHLDLSSVMTARDLTDAATARGIAEGAQTIERLKLLTLLTYADISAVNPTAMNPWRLDQLWRAYLAGHAEFTRELEAERIHLPPAQANAEFIEGFPTRYLKTHSAAEIETHVALARRDPAVSLDHVEGAWRVTVITRDRPSLLASISGVLASFGCNILKAEAFVNARGLALETLTFADPHRTLELNPPEVERLRETVLLAVQGNIDVSKLLSQRPRRAVTVHIHPSISFNNEVSETSTLIEIVAEDRPGLLYDLAHAVALLGANIEVVLIDTEAHRALDVFYVTANGRKLNQEQEDALRTGLLAACRPLRTQ